MTSSATTPPWALIPRSQWGAPHVSQFREVRQVGKGTYGEVFLGENLLQSAGAFNNNVVALKKVSVHHAEAKHRHRGLPLNALREIRLLKSAKCTHVNIVKLLEVAATSTSTDDAFLYLVFEYVEHDLAGILDSDTAATQVLTVPAVKCLFRQLLSALEFLHAESICHRDLKCSNLLVTSRNVLKLGDFGLARQLPSSSTSSSSSSAQRRLSLNVITLWYRAPEVLLGDTHYGTLVDMWSAGCILVELLKRTPLFLGKDEPDQMRKIVQLCGQPTERDCPGLVKLPLFGKLCSGNGGSSSGGESLAEYFARKQLDGEASQLAGRLLEMDPLRRASATQALQSQFVTQRCPRPEELPVLDGKASLHEWETKRKRKQLEAAQAQTDPAAAATVAVAPPPLAPLPPQLAVRPASSSSEGGGRRKFSSSSSLPRGGEPRSRRSRSPAHSRRRR